MLSTRSGFPHSSRSARWAGAGPMQGNVCEVDAGWKLPWPSPSCTLAVHVKEELSHKVSSRPVRFRDDFQTGNITGSPQCPGAPCSSVASTEKSGGGPTDFLHCKQKPPARLVPVGP